MSEIHNDGGNAILTIRAESHHVRAETNLGMLTIGIAEGKGVKPFVAEVIFMPKKGKRQEDASKPYNNAGLAVEEAREILADMCDDERLAGIVANALLSAHQTARQANREKAEAEFRAQSQDVDGSRSFNLDQ